MAEEAFIHADWLPFLLLPAAVTSGLFFWRRRQLRKDGIQPRLDGATALAWTLTGVTVLYLFSSSTNDIWFYFLRWPPFADRPDNYPLLKAGTVRFCILASVAMPILVFCRTKTSMWVVTTGILVWSQITCFNQLWHGTGGQALYSDDHPSLIYRLWVYGQSFPRLIYYDPLWNAGKEASYLVSTGVVPLGTFLLPLWKFFQTDMVYTPAIALAFAVIVPLMAGFAVRIVGGGWTAACCASILGIGISQHFFLWLLHFGTVGSCFALPFVMLVCACIYRVLYLDGFENWTGIVLVLAAVMFLAWPPSTIMAVLLVPALLFCLRQWSAKKMTYLTLCGIMAAVLYMPFLVGILWHIDPVGFAQAGAKKVVLSHEWLKGFERLYEHLRQGNPLLVFYGLVALWFLPQKGMKTFYGVFLVGLAMLAGWGDSWKPQLQLSRAGIPMFFVAITPAALWLGKLLQEPSTKMIPVRAAILVLLLLSGLNSARLYGNKGLGPYVTMNPEMNEIVSWIKNDAPENSRVLFAGMTVHGYGRGHIAYLPVLTGREMMACDYYHFSPSRVEYDYPPRFFRENEEKMSEFMNLYNVGCILTYHDTWKDFFRKHPDQYEEIKSFGDKKKRTVFKVKREPNQFFKGSGTVKAGINELKVKVSNPFEEVVIKYNWVEGLCSEAPVEIKPFEVGKDVRFILVNPHGKAEFRILYRKWL